VFFNGVWDRWQIILSKDSKKIKEKIMRDEQPVDSATRTFGWIITILSGFGIYTMVQYIESLDLNNFINTIIALPIFWGCFMGQFILIEKFDLFADRKK